MQLELDRVVFMPVGEAPHREIEQDPGAEARLEMVELAVAGDERFEVSRIEVDRDGPVVHVGHARARCASEAPDDELFLILGGDQAAALASWHEPEQVLELATVAVVERVELGRATRSWIRIGRLAGARSVRFLDMPLIQMSSSAIRRAGACRASRSATWCRTAWPTTSPRTGLYGAGRAEEAVTA